MQINRRVPRNVHREKVDVGDWRQTVRRLWQYLVTYEFG